MSCVKRITTNFINLTNEQNYSPLLQKYFSILKLVNFKNFENNLIFELNVRLFHLI